MDVLGFLNDSDDSVDFKKLVKKDEEIKKFETNENYSELNRAIHLLKRGYAIQKLSIVQCLDRYLKEHGANQEMFPIILESLLEWDEKMQTECARSFIKPLKTRGLVTQDNLQRILYDAMEILMNEKCFEFEDLIAAWEEVLDHVLVEVELDYIASFMMPQVEEFLAVNKPPFVKKKKAIRMLTAICKAQPEKCFEHNTRLLKIIEQQIGNNPDWQIRIEAAKFFRDYIPIVKQMFPDEPIKPLYISYLAEEDGFLNDEDIDIAVIAIETATEILEEFSEAQIEQAYLKNFERSVERDDDDGILQLVKLVGKAFYKISLKGIEFLRANQGALLPFYRKQIESQNEQRKRAAVFNFPVIAQLFKADFEQIFDVSLQEKVAQLVDDPDYEIRMTMERSLHEIFKLMEQEEDTGILRRCLLNLFERREESQECLDNSPRTVERLQRQHNSLHLDMLSENLDTILDLYANKHAIENVDAIAKFGFDISPQKQKQSRKGLTPVSGRAPFMEESKGMGLDNSEQKKRKKSTLGLISDEDKEREPEPIKYPVEFFFSDMLPYLMSYVSTITGDYYNGMWRSQLKLFKALNNHIYKFNIPEVHENLWQICFNLSLTGQKDVKEEATKLLAQMIFYQYRTELRERSIQEILTLATSDSCIRRKTFVIFIRKAVKILSADQFRQIFYTAYQPIFQDKISQVKIEYCNTASYIRLKYHSDIEIKSDMCLALDSLRQDPNQDVREAVERSERSYMQESKKLTPKVKQSKAEADQQRERKWVELEQREKEEEEEEKRRKQQEDENGLRIKPAKKGKGKGKKKSSKKDTLDKPLKKASDKKRHSAIPHSAMLLQNGH